MMIESEIKTKQPKTKAPISNIQNGRNEERKREKGNWNFKHLKGQSQFMIYRRINKKKIFISMAEILSRADAYKWIENACIPRV